ncbi:hypothetical protein GCM10023185_00200 [Hymenobacter saemangeumensis]|uniref:histidine kinase n=1 Tax=Hymenobacter saemangeumensis TaxID=1084522 RepID=A0ABP8HWJ2_9BACT
MELETHISPEVLHAERQRTLAAEAEVARLRAQLEAITAEAASAGMSPPDAVQELARVVEQLRKLEEEFENQQGLVMQVINASPNLISVQDDDGRLIMVNKSYAHILSWMTSRSRPQVQVDGEAVELQYPQTARTLKKSIAFEECYHLQNGEIRTYQTTQSPLMRADGSCYLLTFSSDITALKRATQLAEESVQAKQDFLANMSHEIRTPLHGVMGLADLLMKSPLTPEQADYVEMIQSSTENLLVVINDILDFAKIESGSISLENIPFDIGKTVQDAVRSLSFKANEKGLLLRVVGANDPLPLAVGDPYRLRQVLVNLISNAVKFTRQGAITVTIDASQRNGMALPVTFSVADTGMGISSENLEQVFGSFRQANSSIARLYGGTGLGLTICKNLVELQGGSIGVRSELGHGSCFYFTIPYTISSEPVVKETVELPAPDLLKGLSILFAEDNAINQLIAVSMMSQWQVEVDIAQNGEEAVGKSWQRKYDLVLMDVQMPVMDGIEATARLRAEGNPNARTPVIALTADAVRLNQDTREDLGFNDLLNKPYSELALYKIIARVSQRAEGSELPTDAPLPASELGLHYDFELLGKLAEDTEFIRKMLQMYLTRMPGQVQALQDAVAQQDYEGIRREAHVLKSTFGTLNIQPEVSSLKIVEGLAEAKAPTGEIEPLVKAVAKAAQLFLVLFAEDLAKLPPAKS